MKLSVIIPVYNEEKNLIILANELLGALYAFKDIFEVIWVDDGSKDKSFESILKILNPIRTHVTSKLSLSLLHLLTYFVSIPFYLYLKIMRPSKPYFEQLRQFSFSHVHGIIFDQLLPDVANYFSESEAKNLLLNSGFKNVTIITPPNKNGWIVRGRK
ncbi:MAG: glycosyltransferase [Candidatus Taylorbacteria bacterium]|nr:glycosyltransferase [Candidatus Taylorbacteria bacterium]